jgi:hypothetical protein
MWNMNLFLLRKPSIGGVVGITCFPGNANHPVYIANGKAGGPADFTLGGTLDVFETSRQITKAQREEQLMKLCGFATLREFLPLWSGIVSKLRLK